MLSTCHHLSLLNHHQSVTMKGFFFFISLLASLALAAPTSHEDRDVLDWSPTLAEFYSRVESHIHAVKRTSTFSNLVCDLSDAQMPAAPTPLPAPLQGLTVKHVAIGRGVQVRNAPVLRWPEFVLTTPLELYL